MMIRNLNESSLAVVSLLFSASMWGIIWYPLRLLNEAGMMAVWSSLVIFLAAGVLAIPVFFRPDNNIATIRLELLILAIAAGITNVAFVVALIEGEVMRMMLLFYLSPIWTVLLGRWWLGEKLSLRAVLILCLAMCGSLVMLWHPDIGMPWPHGRADWLALLASVAFSVNNVMVRKLRLVSMRLKTGVIWWGVVIVSVFVLVWQQEPIPSVSIQVWGGAWLLGWLGIVTMTIAALYGIARMPVYRSSVIMLFELVVAAIAAWWLTNEVMSMQEWFGGCLILFSAYKIARIES